MRYDLSFSSSVSLLLLHHCAGTVKGELITRDYSCLYVTGPNVSGTAQQALAAWVKRGGMLVLTPGAAIADEYNEPIRYLDNVVGLQTRKAVRTSPADDAFFYGFSDIVSFIDPLFGATPMHVRALDVPLVPTPGGATAAATYSNGGAAITQQTYCAGKAIAYAFFPGWQYWHTPDQSLEVGSPTDPTRLPGRWASQQRRVATAPAVTAKAREAVQLSHEVVEACRLESEAGVAIVLLNWSDEPIANLQVSVDVSQPLTHVSTASGARVSAMFRLDKLTVTLPLEHVEIVMLEP